MVEKGEQKIGTQQQQQQMMQPESIKKVPGDQQQAQPGMEHQMSLQPIYDDPEYKGTGKLKDKVAIVTGGDSGIGRSVCVLYAREGADIVLSYLNEHKDAEETRRLVEKEGRRCILVPGDIGNSQHCSSIVDRAMREFGHIDVLVNNAGQQYYSDDLTSITDEQLEKTFRTNIFSMFYLSRECLKHMKEGSAIVNSTSVNAWKGHQSLIDYSSTKGAIVAFTRSLALQLAEKNIRVNAVAPGPIWTPLIPATFPQEKVEKFGQSVPMKRPGQPIECAKSYVFLAAKDSSYMTGTTLHVDGGAPVGHQFYV